MAERTLPSYMSPIEGYATWADDRPVAYFEWAIPATHTTGSCQTLYVKVTDAGVQTAEYYNRGIFINYSNTGAKSGNAEVDGLSCDIDSTGNCSSVFGVNIYTGGCSGATVNRICAYTCYMDASTGTVNQKSGMYLYVDGTGATLTFFIELRAAGTIPNTMIGSTASANLATNFLRLAFAGLPAVTTAGTYSTADGYLNISIAGSAYRIPYFAGTD